MDGARRHHGGNSTGETRQERDERASGQAAFRHHVIQQERRARQVAGIFQKQDEGEQNRNLRQEHQHAAGTGNHAIDEQVVEDARRHVCADPFAQCGKAAFDGVHNRRRPSVNRLEHHKQDDQQQNHTQHRMQHDVVQFLMPCRQRHFRADDLCQNRFDFLIKFVALQRIEHAFGRGGAGRERAFARQLGHRLAHRVYARRAHRHRFQNGYAQQLAQFGRIDIQAPFAGNVAHVQRHHHRQSQRFQFQNHAQGHTQVGRVGNGNDGVGRNAQFAHGDIFRHRFVGASRAQAVCARQVDNADGRVVEEGTLALIDRYARIIGNLGMGAGQAVEQNGFAAVWRTDQGEIA